MKKLSPLTTTCFLAAVALVVCLGCANLSPGADPLVVRVEQTLSGASATFDLVLNVDQTARPFWKTNAPAFHRFCEWLRTPTDYRSQPVPRCVAAQLQVDDLKLIYQASRTSENSNALWSAWSVLNSAISQATSWSNIITAPVH